MNAHVDILHVLYFIWRTPMYRLPDYDIYNEWTPEQHFQRIDKYSNYLIEEQRIETWAEVVTRTVDTLRYLSNDNLTDTQYQRMFELIYTHDIMPSMRLLSMPFDAIVRDNSVIYNCCAGICDTPRIFSEAQYLSMSGVGITWSVESKNVDKLPVVQFLNGSVDNLIIDDSQLGWATATNQLINALYAGTMIQFDYSKIRPAGAPLKTKGGYASGPNILIEFHEFIKRTFANAQGRKLSTLEVHDLMCYALESGISGGKRRAAGACLFDKDDDSIRNCKYNGFWNHPDHRVRANANNSIVWSGHITESDIDELTEPWISGTGEPNLFKRDNAMKTSRDTRVWIEPENISSNPCFVAGTMVQTRDGHYPIESLIGKTVEVWNGYKWVTIDNFRETGQNENVYTISLHDGTEITATAYHRFILEDDTSRLLKDLVVGDKLKISEAPNTHDSITNWNRIVSIKEAGIAESVYCCTVPETNQFSLSCGIDVGNCFEIYLQPISEDSTHIAGGGWQFCNLTTVNARESDTINELEDKVYYATLIGDIQSLATDFGYIRSGSKTICDTDRLLGVNLVGYANVPLLRQPNVMAHLRQFAELTDKMFSLEFDVPVSAGITSVAPKGNGSVFSATAPGMNVLHSAYQIRNMTVVKTTTMFEFLKNAGVPYYEYPGKDYAVMFSFPVAYPQIGALTLDNTSAIQQLEIWREHKLNWCHHNPSCSITYEAHEIDDIKDWLLENQDIIGGIAFFPKYDSSYELLPIVTIDEQRYTELMKEFPTIDWASFNTLTDERQKVMECSGGACEIQW